MYNLEYTARFKKEYKLALKRGYDDALIMSVITSLANRHPLPAKYKVHKLSGIFKDCWECHILPDWLLIWQIRQETNSIILIATGTHSDLF